MIEKPKPSVQETIKGLIGNEHFALVLILIALIAGFGFMTDGKFTTTRNAANLVLRSSAVGIASMGQAFVILTAGIDLSVGGLAILCGVVGASFMTGDIGFPLGAIAIALLVGLAWGAINGVLVSRLRIPALIVTLATWIALGGIAYVYIGGVPVGNLPDSFSFIGQGKIGGVPVPAIIFLTVAAVCYLVMDHTTFGRSVYAVGGNPATAMLCGVNTSNTTFMVYVISGFCAAASGLILTSRLMSGSLLSASGLELDSIAAVVIGGVSLAGGKGTMIGVILGVFIITVISNGMNLMLVPAAYQKIIKGVIIIIAVAIDSARRH